MTTTTTTTIASSLHEFPPRPPDCDEMTIIAAPIGRILASGMTEMILDWCRVSFEASYAPLIGPRCLRRAAHWSSRPTHVNDKNWKPYVQVFDRVCAQIRANAFQSVCVRFKVRAVLLQWSPSSTLPVLYSTEKFGKMEQDTGHEQCRST